MASPIWTRIAYAILTVFVAVGVQVTGWSHGPLFVFAIWATVACISFTLFMTWLPVRTWTLQQRRIPMLIAMSSLGFVVFGCLWWAISSFSMPVGSHIDQSVDQRTYIQVHPSDLMELVSKKPEIIDLKHLGNVPPSDRFRENMATFDVYIGHWWAIETRLLSLQKNNRTQAVEIICQDAHATPAFSCDFPPEKASSLLSYKPGDTIRIIGRVKFIDTLVSLDECEIGASDSKLTFYRVPKR